MSSLSSLQDTVAAILASPAPVLAVDACGILDLLRSQYRLESPSRLLEKSLGALDASTRWPARLHLVVFSQIRDEVDRNIEDEQRKLKEHILTLKNAGCAVLSVANAAEWKRSIQMIEETISNFPQKWIESSHLVASHPACILRAQARLTGNTAPGRRGSNNIGDCVITEHLLELGGMLRKAGFTESFIFVSSNVKDFGRTIPKAPLDVEFQAAQIDYLPHIEAAMVQLCY